MAHAPTALIAGLLLVATLSCRASLPVPVLGTHPPGCAAFVEVPFPPPPARVEMVGERPREGAVWVDGEWVWRGKRWSWEPGGWVMPPDGFYAPWVLVRREDGSLYHVRGRWFDGEGKPLVRPSTVEKGQEPRAPGPLPAAPRCDVPD